MKVLLIHPEDAMRDEDSPWAATRWDRVIDLGTSGAREYAKAAAAFGVPVTALASFRENFRELRKVRELLGFGIGRLTDSFGLDWWEMTSIDLHQRLETAILLRELAESFGQLDEVHVSRPGFHADALRLALGPRLRTFDPPANRRKGGTRHYFQLLKKFPAWQLAEIFWDKQDSGYQFRGRFSSRPKPQADPVVLLPSSYINVGRTAVAYAEGLPDARFLLVVTRRSGWMENLPPNVSATWLRRYASLASRGVELRDLLRRWQALRAELSVVPEFRTLSDLGCFEDLPEQFARGLEIRDAWRNVLESEPVQGVICADDSNPATHIPMLLAAHRGLPAIACHHGALDGRYIFKSSHADKLLAKGRMEEDYLLRVCRLAPDKVEVGAPAVSGEPAKEDGRSGKSCIVFFSEPYEVAGGRCRDFYADILPPLVDLALSDGKRLIIKLHPSESVAERSSLVQRILRGEQRQVVRIVAGPLRSELLDDTWFGVSVMSTVTVECALMGIPCFLCAWLEVGPFAYIDQFTRFGAGFRLGRPDEIREIPATLRDYKISRPVQESCRTPIKLQRLRSLLGLGLSREFSTDPQADRVSRNNR